jgi:hypothetical protein
VRVLRMSERARAPVSLKPAVSVRARVLAWLASAPVRLCTCVGTYRKNKMLLGIYCQHARLCASSDGVASAAHASRRRSEYGARSMSVTHTCDVCAPL